MEVKNKYVAIKNPIDGFPNESDFSICEELLSVKLQPSQGSDDVVIVQNLYVSIDPSQINRMKTHSFVHNTFPEASAVLPGQVINNTYMLLFMCITILPVLIMILCCAVCWLVLNFSFSIPHFSINLKHEI